MAAPKNPIAPAPVNDDLGITASLGYDTNYVWRGLNFGQHWVRSGLNGSVLLLGGAGEDGAGGTSLNWDVQFGTLAGDQDHFYPTVARDQSFQRLQLGASVAHDMGPATVSLGYRYYRNMGGLTRNSAFLGGLRGMNDGQEVSLGVATALGPVNIASSANYDFVNHSWYFDLDASCDIVVCDSFSIVPFANIGFGHNMNWQWARNSFLATNSSNNVTGWSGLYTGVRFPVKLNSRATLIPYIAANVPLGVTQNMGATALRAGLPDTPYQSVLMGGVTLSVRF